MSELYYLGGRYIGPPSRFDLEFHPVDDGDHPTSVDNDVWEKQVGLYCDALEAAAAAAGHPATAQVVEISDAEIAQLIGGPVEDTFPAAVLQDA